MYFKIIKLIQKYPKNMINQLLRLFEAYDTQFTGYIQKKDLENLCNDLNIKPWKALNVKINNYKGN